MMGNFDLVEEFGVDADFANSLDISSKLAIAAGIEALRDAGIPLVRIYKETSTGGVLPLNWVLPDYMKDDTGIIFASSLPGGDSIVEEVSKFYSYKYGKKSKSELIKLYPSFIQKIKDEKDREELTDWYTKNYSDIAEDIGEDDEYQLNRKLLLRFLAMGHSQLAQYIGARGPSIQLNTACSSTPAAIGVAEDWIRTGRAKRVIVVGSDSLSSERLREWILSGFIAIGAHSTEADYRKAALPFDKRRNGMIVGMGAVGVVIEAESDLKMRGMEPIAEVIATDYCNSAFHATRLDVDHISFAMDRLLTKVERLLNIERKDIADKLVYMAHETYTPPRGSIGAVEAESLRRNFKERHKDIVVTNTKGLTGHAMGAGIEDVVLLKALQTGKVPPIANYKEYDPVIGDLKLSKGGYYNNIEYGMRLGAGFGSQLSITFMKLKSKNENRMVDEKAYSNWLQSVSGINDPELEVVSRTLRIKDDGSIAKKRRQERKDRKDEQKEIISQKSYMPQKAIDLPSVIEEPKEEVSSSVSISSNEEVIRKRMLEIVSEKTGYPEDLIEFDLDMESDLGIDTVKQAEMFGLIRESFNIPSEEGIKIKDFPTLNHVIDFVKQKSQSFHDTSSADDALIDQGMTSSDIGATNAVSSTDVIRKRMLEIVSEKTGYPEDLIEFDLDMESDLGIDTVKQAEMFGLIRESFNIPSEEGIKIKDFPTLNHVVNFVKQKSQSFISVESSGISHERIIEKSTSESSIKRMIVRMVEEPIEIDKDPRFDLSVFNILITDDGRGIAESLSKKFTDSNAHVEILYLNNIKDDEELVNRIEGIELSGKINGLVHLTPLEESKFISELSFDEWKRNTFLRVKSLFIIVKHLHIDLIDNAKSAKSFIVGATPLGGYLGFDEFTGSDPIGGGVTGLLKSFDKELNNVLVKSIDFSMKMKPSNISQSIFNEIQYGDVRIEQGYIGKKRFIPEIITSVLETDTDAKVSFDSESVFIITGGGYGITSEFAKDIAKHFNSHIVIISRQGLPENIEEIASLDDLGLKELKDKVIEELKSSNDKVTPVMIEKEFGKYTNAIEKYRNVQEMKSLGASSVEYCNCDVSDHDKMFETIGAIRSKYKRVDAIIHGAGLEQSKLLEDKSYEDFCRIFDVKADGCYNLIELTKDDNVKSLVIFSSISARFGNAGQSDYSSANDLLCKYTQQANKRFKGSMRAVSIDWTGWKDVGMATRGSLLTIFENAGVDLISLEDGVRRAREEMLYGDEGEVLIAGSLGDLDSDGLITNMSKDIFELENRLKLRRESCPLIDKVLDYKPSEILVVGKRLDVERDIYLKDHMIEDIPYLPAVMGIESFAEAASLIFPNMVIDSMRDIRFHIPVKLLKDSSVDILISVERVGEEDGIVELQAKLETEFFNKDGKKLGDNRVHFTASIFLKDGIANLEGLDGNGINMDSIASYNQKGNITISYSEIYKRFFHGPRFQVHGGVLEIDNNTVLGVMRETEEELFDYVKKPIFKSNPMAFEAAFQNAGVLEMKRNNVMSLPDTIDELHFRSVPDDIDNLFLMAIYRGGEDNKHSYDIEVVDKDGNIYSIMKGYKMIITGVLEEGEKL
ncbi:MAG: SDR family NAD(P)-dependent oxidoreductase [Spirochaetota bacterium]|nr:SDR family NAD(P)-dependent oxidoreductase [Spirochaetota bacterium]